MRVGQQQEWMTGQILTYSGIYQARSSAEGQNYSETGWRPGALKGLAEECWQWMEEEIQYAGLRTEEHKDD